MTKAFRGLLAALVVLLCTDRASAFVTDHEGWFQFTATGPIHGRLRGFLEAQPRIGIDAETNDVAPRLLIARGAFGWDVLPGWSLWAGYGYTPAYNPDRDEHRAFEQSLVEWTLGPFKASNRTRLEQRFFQQAPNVSWRVRNQIRLAYPLPRHPSWSLVAADEFFVNLNTVKTAPVTGFDQNRLFLGVSQQITSHLRVEVDYLNQMLNGRRGSDDTMRHSGFLQVAVGW